MSMVEDPGGFEPPFQYRLLAPLVVKAMRGLHGYPIEVDFTEEASFLFHVYLAQLPGLISSC